MKHLLCRCIRLCLFIEGPVGFKLNPTKQNDMQTCACSEKARVGSVLQTTVPEFLLEPQTLLDLSVGHSAQFCGHTGGSSNKLPGCCPLTGGRMLKKTEPCLKGGSGVFLSINNRSHLEPPSVSLSCATLTQSYRPKFRSWWLQEVWASY